MINPPPVKYEESMMTYLSQFARAELKEGVQKEPKDISKIKVSGSGING